MRPPRANASQLARGMLERAALALACALSASTPLLAQEPRADRGDAAARARRILEDRSYQRELPAPRAARPPERSPDLDLSWAVGSGEVVKLLALLALGGVAAFALFRLAVALGDARARRPAEAAAPPRASRALPSQTDGISARELLAAGRTAEALHALLVELLRELAPQAPASRTTRELVRELALDEPRRAALLALARTVERALFAVESLTPSEVEAGFTLAAALRGGAAAR